MNVPLWNPGPCSQWPPRDWCSKKGAEELASKIVWAWLERGYTNVEAWVQPIDEIPTRKLPPAERRMWAVRTNLVGGLPPKEAA